MIFYKNFDQVAPGHVSRSLLSSNAMRAQARAEAAAALKRAEMQKKIKDFQMKSALAME